MMKLFSFFAIIFESLRGDRNVGMQAGFVFLCTPRPGPPVLTVAGSQGDKLVLKT